MKAVVIFLLVALVVLSRESARAGDAVMWNQAKQDFVAEYSGTPQGGKDYMNEEQAVESVQKTMRKQRVVGPVLVWKSDRTGYFSVWTGLSAGKTSVAVVGFGATEVEAKVKGLAELRKAGAKSQFFIAYCYSSYGQDYVATSPPLADLSTRAVVNEEISSFSPDDHFALRTAHSRGWKFRRFDLVDLQTFEYPLELGAPTDLFGSIVWSQDAQRFAFFGEEAAYGETAVYFREGGKFVRVALPERDKYPDPELGLAADERVFKTKNDMVHPKDWLESGDLELEHKVAVVVEKHYEQIATVEATTTLTIHFDEGRNPSIISVAQQNTRKQLAAKPRAKDLSTLPVELPKKPGN